jgi:malate dehydrogenase (oxaloacetate-decarboxylating)(NADP+)
MEGKALLFKIFADIDVFDIEVDVKDIDKFIETVKGFYFGGINLEDIKVLSHSKLKGDWLKNLTYP